MSDPAQRERSRSRSRAIAGAAVVWFFVSTLLLVSPIFFIVGNAIEPRWLGLPFSLVYVLGIVAINFVVLAGLYMTRAIDPDEDDG